MPANLLQAHFTDEQAMQWGLKLSKMEGIIPAIETAHFLPFWTK
jgi:tryptophan synthase beta subunit